jgi:hypothetical protein
VSQTAVQGRNRLAEFTGESFDIHAEAHLGVMQSLSLTEGRTASGQRRPKPERPPRGLNAARMFHSEGLATPLNVGRSFRSLRPHCGCG